MHIKMDIYCSMFSLMRVNVNECVGIWSSFSISGYQTVCAEESLCDWLREGVSPTEFEGVRAW